MTPKARAAVAACVKLDFHKDGEDAVRLDAYVVVDKAVAEERHVIWDVLAEQLRKRVKLGEAKGWEAHMPIACNVVAHDAEQERLVASVRVAPARRT